MKILIFSSVVLIIVFFSFVSEYKKDIYLTKDFHLSTIKFFLFKNETKVTKSKYSEVVLPIIKNDLKINNTTFPILLKQEKLLSYNYYNKSLGECFTLANILGIEVTMDNRISSRKDLLLDFHKYLENSDIKNLELVFNQLVSK